MACIGGWAQRDSFVVFVASYVSWSSTLDLKSHMEREWGEWSLFSEQWIASSNFRLNIVQHILWSAWRPWAEKVRNEFVLGVTGTVLKHMWNIRCATKCLSNLSWCNKQSVIPSWRPWSPWWPKSSWSPLWLWSGLVLKMFQSWVFKSGFKVDKI